MGRQVISLVLDEGSTKFIDIVFRDETGQPFVPSEVIATLYDIESGQVINGRDGQNVKNQNGGNFAENNYTFELTPLDLPIINPARGRETHLLLLTSKWASGGARVHHTEIEHVVRNLTRSQ